MKKEFLDALDERIGHRKMLHEALDEPIKGGASWAYVFGSATLTIFLVQLLTGLILAVYYSPSATDAWASVAYLEREIAMGAIVRGIHHHAAGGMVVMAVLHMLQVVAYGAYKAPREGNWITGLGLLGLVLAFALTGYLLPWDQTGYWATKVATSIAGTLPSIGPTIQKIAQGGNDYGNLTLTRFYAIHVIVLPLATLGLIGAHMSLFRRHGVTPSANKSEAQLAKTETFWPKQVAYDAAFAFFVVGFIVYLAVNVGAPLQAPADPASNFIARPEWYFLFLFQLLKYFEGPLQIVGTVILPGAASTFLLLLPFLDRSPDRRVRARLPWVGAIAAGILGIMMLTGLALHSDSKNPTIADQKAVAKREADRAKLLAKDGIPPAGAAYMLAHDPLVRGERIFRKACRSCHALEGYGPKEPKGPELTGYGSKAWIRQILRDPDSHRLYGLTKIEGMPSFAKLSDAELKLLTDLVYSRRLKDAPSAEEHPAAALVETHECGNCHDFEDEFGLEGPALKGYQSKDWLLKLLENPAEDHLFGESNEMPAFGARLPVEDRQAVVDFLLSLPERADTQKWPFVDEPAPTPRTKTSSTASK